MSQGTVRGFSVSTRCETVEEFIATFRDRCDEKSIVVNVVEPRVVGTECAFAILLTNKKPVLAGTCMVLDVFMDANNPFKRRGMRLGINRLGVESERVFVQLTQARLAAKRKTTEIGFRPMSRAPTIALPIVTADVAVGDAVVISASVPIDAPVATAAATNARPPIALARKLTEPMRGLRADTEVDRVPPPRFATVLQIPPLDKPEKAIERKVRATPPIVGPERTLKKRPTNSPDAIVAEGSTETRRPIEASTAAPESRAPGSTFILPANPLTGVPDISLQGLVDCRLFESTSSMEPMLPRRIAHGTVDEPLDEKSNQVSDGVVDGATSPVEMPAVIGRAQRRDDLSAVPEPLMETPPPLAPPPLVETPRPIVAPDEEPAAVATIVAATARSHPRSRRWIALAFVSAAGAVFAIIALSRTTSTAAPPRIEATIETNADDVTVRGTEHTEAAPPAPPVRTQPTHAVLIKTFPNAATVTAGDQSFGTTPTLIKIPGNTPVEVHIVRRGFKPITRVVTSRRRYDQVFVRLEAERPRKLMRSRRPVSQKPKQMTLDDL